MDQERFEKALIFAAQAHQGQNRKGSDVPYITHPIMLAMTLLEMDCADDLIVAALLHDVIEDTETTLTQIETEFGPAVAQLVDAVSEPDRQAAWEVRKQHTIDKLRQAPVSVKLIACADKLHNIRSICKDYQTLGEAVWARFKRGKESQAWYYRGLADSLPTGLESPETYPIFAQFRQEVTNLFGPHPPTNQPTN